MSEVTVTLSAKEAQLLAAIKQATKGFGDLETGVSKVGKATTEAAKAQRELEREAAKVKQATLTPTEQYNQKLARLKQLLDANKLTQAEYRRAVQQTTVEHEKALAAGEASFGATAVGKLATFAAGYLTVNAAIQTVVASLREQEETEARIAGKTQTIAEAQAGALRNLGPATPEKQAEFISATERIAREAKPAGGLKTVYQAMGTGFASFGPDIEAVSKAVTQAAKIAPESAEEISAITAAILHLGKATKSSNAEENLGFMLAVGQQAAVTTTRAVAENITPGVIGVTGYGGTAAESGALVSAITQGMADTEGRFSSTAAIAMAQQLAEFLPETATYKYKEEQGKTVRVVDRAATGLKTTTERIEYLRQHPQVREEFLAGASFEKKAQVPVEQLLGVEGRGTVAYDYFKEARKAIPTGKAAAGVAQSMASQISAPFEQRVAAAIRGQQASTESLEQANKKAAMGGAVTWGGEGGVQQGLAATGAGWIEQQWAGAIYGAKRLFGATSQEAAASVIGGRLEEMQKPRVPTYMGGSTAGFIADLMGAPIKPEATKEQQNMMQLLSVRLAELQKSIDANTKATATNSDATRQTAPQRPATLVGAHEDK